MVQKGIMAEKKEKKFLKKKPAAPVGSEPMGREEADAELSRFFASLEEQYRDVPQEELERGAKKVKDFIGGKLSWAELYNFTPEMLFQMAEYGFMQFKQGRYDEAERFFKVLTVLDWNNAYYHSVMGSILQRQKRYGDAIAEYTQAIELDEQEISSYTNRGEIFMQHGLVEEAAADFSRAVELDSAEQNKFANRARVLLQQLDRMRKEGEKKRDE